MPILVILALGILGLWVFWAWVFWPWVFWDFGYFGLGYFGLGYFGFGYFGVHYSEPSSTYVASIEIQFYPFAHLITTFCGLEGVVALKFDKRFSNKRL